MPRSGEDARRRLREAALELYAERGFDQTTAAQIAARAGVNTRTYFRHFADKREVLFDGEAALRTEVLEAVAEAPADLEPLEALRLAFRRAGRLLEARQATSRQRLAVIAATPELRERELAKAATMTEAVAGALRERGVAPRTADLAAHVGWTAFHHAAGAWVEDPSPGMAHQVDQAFADLRQLCLADSPATTQPGH